MTSLAGVTVVVTRARHQADVLTSLFEQEGAHVVEFPVIDIVDADDSGVALEKALVEIDSYDWLVVTSVNTVVRISDSVGAFTGHVAAIGAGTASALQEAGIAVDLVPDEYIAESLVHVFPGGSGRVLLPRAAVARDVLPDSLRAKGWDVNVVDAYKTVSLEPDKEKVIAVECADVITFTASSTVEAFVKTRVSVPGFVACIGPITAATALWNGMQIGVVANEHTAPGLVSAVVEAWHNPSKDSD